MADLKNDKKSRRPLKNLPSDGFQPKALFLWLGIVVIVGSILYFSGRGQSAPQDKTIYQALQLAQAGSFKEGTLWMQPDPNTGGRSSYQIEGELKPGVEVAEGKSAHINASGTVTEAEIA